MSDLRYEAIIGIVQIDSKSVYLEGALYNLSDQSQIVVSPAPAGHLSIGIRGEKRNGSIIFDERANLNSQIMSPSEVFKFKLGVNLNVLSSCDSITVALVREGDRWLLSEGSGIEFSICKNELYNQLFLEPKNDYKDNMFKGSDYLKTMYAGYYLNKVSIKYGLPVALDFAYNYFLGRNVDSSGNQNATNSILNGANLFCKLCYNLYESEECQNRLKHVSIGNPYHEIGRWANFEEPSFPTVFFKEDAE